MIIFTSEDLNYISQIVNALHESSAPEDLLHALTLVASAVKASAGGIAFIRSDGTIAAEPVQFNTDDELVAEYRALSHTQRSIPFDAMSKGMRVWRLTDIMTQREWDNSEINSKVLRPRGFFHPVGITFGDAEEYLGQMWLVRSKQDSPFSDKDISLLTILYPHIELTLRDINLGSDAEPIVRCMISGAARMSRPVFIFDKNGTLVHMNSSAALQFSKEGLSRNDGLNRVRSAIENKGVYPNGEPILVENRVAICLLGGSQHRLLSFFIEGSVSRYLVVIATEEASIFFQFINRTLSRYPLTERELQVCVKLMLGKRNNEIAEELSLSELTVKDHVKAVLRKMCIKSRAEIPMRLLCIDEEL